MRVRGAHAFALALGVGIACANAARVGRVGVVAGLALVACAAFVRADARVVLASLGLACVGWWWGTQRLDALDRSVLDPRVGTAERTVADVTAPARRSKYQLRVPVQVVRFGRAPTREPALLELPPGRAPPQGARLSFVATVEEPRGPADGFDERTWLRRQGVHVVLRADRWRAVGSRSGIGGFADALNARVARPLVRAVHGDRGAVLAGIVLGNDQAVPEELRKRFRASGLYHLLAVSGQNVALLAGGSLFAVLVLGGPRWLGHVVALASIGAYVLAVGPQPSVLRAGVVGALASFAWLAARQRDRWHFLLLAALVLLAWNPYSVFDAGFELSFVAVAAIFTLVPRAVRVLDGYPLPQWVREGAALAAVCGAVTAPILWIRFHQLPLATIPANLAAEPAMPPLLGLALTAAVVDPFAPGVANVLAWLAGWCAAWVSLCARVVGGLPGAQVTSNCGGAAVGAVAACAGAYAWRRWRAS